MARSNPSPNKPKEGPRSVLVVPSKSIPVVNNLDGAEETEITAEISVPTEGGWGWVVVFASFTCGFVLDGVFFTFGAIYKDMTDDLGIPGTLVALINSIAVALYFICGPLISALVNRFGFRACTMAGSIVLSFSFLGSYFVTSYVALIMFYGIISGFGACLVLVPSSVVVGFYFERLRAIALAIAGLGSSLGIMIMFTVNSYIVNIAGWRIVTLFHAGLFGILFFIGMAFRPLLVVTLTQITETKDPTRTVTYLPSLNQTRTITGPKSKKEGVESSAAERLFSAISSPKFPTTASVVQEATKLSPVQAGPSTRHVSKLTLSARSTGRNVSRKHLSQIQSMITNNKDHINIEMEVEETRKKKRKCWPKWCCEWEEHVQESRPMYRDDAFYAGKIEELPIYQKSVIDVEPETRTGLEYQMAVSRAVTTAELEERKGVFTTAVRRVLATMLDPQLLRRCSFLLLCFSGLLTYVGLLIPFVFLPVRNKSEGIDAQHCNLFVSVIGLCNALGRIIAGILASKFNPLILYKFSCILSGISTIAYNFSFDLYYQYFCCVIFGMFIASISGIRSMVIVNCYGLEKLTNATGLMLMSQGFGSLISTPLSGILTTNFGYAVSFYVAGISMIFSGIILFPVKSLLAKEKQRSESNLQSPSKSLLVKEKQQPESNLQASSKQSLKQQKK